MRFLINAVKTTSSGCRRAFPRENMDRVGILVGNETELSTGRTHSSDSLGI